MPAVPPPEDEDGYRTEQLRVWRLLVHKWLHLCDIQDAMRQWMQESDEVQHEVRG